MDVCVTRIQGEGAKDVLAKVSETDLVPSPQISNEPTGRGRATGRPARMPDISHVTVHLIEILTLVRPGEQPRPSNLNLGRLIRFDKVDGVWVA